MKCVYIITMFFISVSVPLRKMHSSKPSLCVFNLKFPTLLGLYLILVGKIISIVQQCQSAYKCSERVKRHHINDIIILIKVDP